MRYRREHFDDPGSAGEFGAPSIEAPGSAPTLRRKRPGVALLPTLFTLGNCLCGFASLGYTARGPAQGDNVFVMNFALAGYFIFAAMLFDLFDGFIARITRSASDFGAELDSLADMVSFGVAPAFLSIRVIGDLLRRAALLPGATLPGAPKEPYAYLPGPFSDDDWLRLFWVISAIYVCCTALRLARFNVRNKHDTASHMNFRGMPSPGAAAVVAATIIFFETLYSTIHFIRFPVPESVKQILQTVFPYLLPLVLLIAALLMVSRFAYAHLINRFLRGRKKFRHVVGFFLLAMLFVWQPQITVLVGIYAYALSAPVTWLVRRLTGGGKEIAGGGEG